MGDYFGESAIFLDSKIKDLHIKVKFGLRGWEFHKIKKYSIK